MPDAITRVKAHAAKMVRQRDNWKRRALQAVPSVDFRSAFYVNCRHRRREGAAICGSCPFRAIIENQERDRKESVT